MLIALVLFAVLIAMNVFASTSVRGGADSRYKQNMLIAMIWLVPLVGLFMAFAHTSPPPAVEKPHAALAGTIDDAAPTALEAAGLVPFAVTAHLASANSFPVMDWQALGQWADTASTPAGARSAWTTGARAWLLHMRDACGPSFRLYETADALILSPLDSSVLVATAAYIATTRRRIRTVLDGVADLPDTEKSVLLVLHDEDAYYDYLGAHYPDEGEFAFSSGVFINTGCAHFVVALADLAAIEPVIAHEMTHSALARLPLPRWLDEGLAVNTEHRLTRVPALIYTPQELRIKHLAYWDAPKMQEFWSGDSFFRTDDGNMLSYELARILVAHLAGDWGRFKDFVLQADRSDAGARALAGQFNAQPGALVCALLGQPYAPHWEPDPAKWAHMPEPAVEQETQAVA